MTRPFLQSLFRPEILDLVPYSARGGVADTLVHLDANENPWSPPGGSSASRIYGSQQPAALVDRLARIYGVAPNQCMVTRGADEAIDLLVRSICIAGEDSILITPPTFGMYKVAARIQSAGVIETPLCADFSLDEGAIRSALQENSPKLAFLCSPGNPTGRVIPGTNIRALAAEFPKTLFVVDEAYVEFSEAPSLSVQATTSENICVLRTLSKAYGLAGARVGALIAPADMVEVLLRVLPPYPVPTPVVNEVMQVLSPTNMPVHAARIQAIVAERERLFGALAQSPYIKKIWPGEGNFLLLDVLDRDDLLARLRAAGLCLRDFGKLSPGWFRLSVGTPEQNDLALMAFGIPVAPGLPPRTGQVSRKTKETDIAVLVELDAPQNVAIDTGIGFYDHMLEQVARHGNFGLTLTARGDLHIDPHHTVEDCALALGQALNTALGDRKGIGRYGFTLPMDETQSSAVIDLSGRPALRYEASFQGSHIGDMPTEMFEHVMESLSQTLKAAIHIQSDGDNDHHIAEGMFKALGRALKPALARTGSDEIPSSKGMLV